MYNGNVEMPKPQPPMQIPMVRFMQDYNVLYDNNAVIDYSVAQGVTNPADLSYQILRDINFRYIQITNSSPTTPIGVAITVAPNIFPIPPIKFYLAPGELRHLGVNSPGGQMQFIHMIDLGSRMHVGDPVPLRTDANSFVLREGINKWQCQTFHYPSFRPAF
jgi:hypothetical protein